MDSEEIMNDTEYTMINSKMMTEDGYIQNVTMKKETLEGLIGVTLSETLWFKFADSTGQWLGYGGSANEDTTEENTTIDVCFPSFEELDEIMKKYGKDFTEEMWASLKAKDDEED